VKTTQKSKKCLRCNKTHQVERILKNGEIIRGMTTAMERVKSLQNELARTELGKNADFISERGFYITQKTSNNPASQSTCKVKLSKQAIEGEIDYYVAFLEVLRELDADYKKFPHYLIKILAEDKGIPPSELSSLIRKAFREGLLIKKKDLYYFSFF